VQVLVLAKINVLRHNILIPQPIITQKKRSWATGLEDYKMQFLCFLRSEVVISVGSVITCLEEKEIGLV